VADVIVVAGRFEIESLAGRGGMGVVYRAKDRTTGGAVALKILHDEAPASHRERLVREARVLASITHPGFVRYLDFGHTDRGKPFLAMEWLEGEDLATRLKIAGVTAGDAIRITTRVASALGVAHARGIVHRDVKPSNLFLVEGDPAHVKLLDFGIARIQAANDAMTRTGIAIGTPRYMAPEQARGSRDVDARADVFSLGCVLFECLTGRPPFPGDGYAAVFARILLEDAPPVAQFRDDLPVELEELVARMLAKDPAARPRDGAAVATALEALGEITGVERRPRRRQTAVTNVEQRLVCVVFASKAMPRMSMPDVTLPTIVDKMQDTVQEVDVTYTVSGDRPATARALSAIVAEHAGRAEVLADTSVVVTLLGHGAATDQAARAARCALALRTLFPDAPTALAIGRSVVGDRVPLGEIIDRAIALAVEPGPIRVDEVSAGLLDVRFAIRGDDHGLVLERERDVAAARTLLGKPIPCVGRERELAALGAIWQECVSEPMSHVVVVSGQAGVGKSRIRYELVDRLTRAGDIEVWIGRGDPISAGAPFAMLGQALRRACGILDDEPASVRHRKLRARVRRYVSAAEAARVTEFLGELVGASAAEVSVQLRAAREDPQLMGDQMLRACEDFVAAECAEHPVLLVLEDLQWSDRPTVQYVDAVARRVADLPFMVLALARPDVDVVFPRLWSERGVERIHVGELTRRAAEKLVREALGSADAELVARLVERAAGNAFYLEELIRSVAEGHGDRLPETVVAMVQARLEALEIEARHVLRAASIFGQVFWRGGVAALLEGTDTHVRDWLDELVRRELITARRDSRFGGELEYTFRHNLVREAAYAMLTDRDRTVGHRLAGDWLEARVRPDAAELDAVALAEHFLRGDAPGRAIAWYRQAAEQALEGDDLPSAIDRAERAIACVHGVGDTASDADNRLVGVLRQLQAGAHAWRGEYALVVERGAEALERLAPTSVPWLVAAAAVADARARRLEHEAVLALCKTLAALPLEPEMHRAYAHAVAVTMTTLLWHGDRVLAEQLFTQLERVAAAGDPASMAWVYTARSWRALRDGDPAASLAFDELGEECFGAVGDLRNACRSRANVGYGQLMLGAYAEAEASLREAIAGATRIGLHTVTAQAQHNLGLALARRGRFDEARRIEAAALAAFDAQGNRRLGAAAHNYLAMIEILAGNPRDAIDHAQRAIDYAVDKPAALCVYRGTLSTAHRLAGNAAAALAEATRAIELVDTHGRPEEGEAAIRLAHAEALRAAGNLDDAQRAIAEAHSRLVAAAEKIGDLERRRAFLEDVTEHAEIRRLARVG
jgi:tetratricopeptide (TPR) repeat protein/predicted Ser/Thr protein kinase